MSNCRDNKHDCINFPVYKFSKKKEFTDSDKTSLNKLCHYKRFELLHATVTLENYEMLETLLCHYKVGYSIGKKSIKNLFDRCINIPIALAILYEQFKVRDSRMGNLDDPMTSAIEYSVTSLINNLLAEEKYRNPINERGEGLVHLAVILNSNTLLTCLFMKNYDLNQKTSLGYYALRMAIINQQVGLISQMLHMGVDKDEKDIGNLYPELAPLLVTTIKYGLFNVATLLIKTGSNTNVTNTRGNCALHFLFFVSPPERILLASLLINHGANINHKNEKGNTPMDEAIKFGDLDLVRLFYAKGGLSQFKNPIFAAVSAKDVNMLLFFINRGYNIDEEIPNPIKPNSSITPLSLAAILNNLSCLETLLTFQPKLSNRYLTTPTTKKELCKNVETIIKHKLISSNSVQNYYAIVKEIQKYGNKEDILKSTKKAYEELQQLELIHLKNEITMKTILQHTIEEVTYYLTDETIRNRIYNHLFNSTVLCVYRLPFMVKLHFAKFHYQHFMSLMDTLKTETTKMHPYMPTVNKKNIAFHISIRHKIEYKLPINWHHKNHYEFLSQ